MIIDHLEPLLKLKMAGLGEQLINVIDHRLGEFLGVFRKLLIFIIIESPVADFIKSKEDL